MRFTALEFYNGLKNKSKYKLVNGLFIVKYLGDGIYEYVGEFNKKGSLGATPTTSFVYKNTGPRRQLFDVKKKLVSTAFGTWRPLGIGFRMKPIGSILN